MAEHLIHQNQSYPTPDVSPASDRGLEVKAAVVVEGSRIGWENGGLMLQKGACG